ncbi:MAG TPA: tetratricopeptide repeat protein, partial [Gemmata sp.]|nr:tetratricopeptide repeat protein [Gemmata sp.]
MSMRIRRREVIFCVGVTAVLVGTAGAIVWFRARTSALLQEGQDALAARDYPRAKELLDRYLARRPQDLRARLLRARVARKLHEYSEAREHLRLCQEGGGE